MRWGRAAGSGSFLVKWFNSARTDLVGIVLLAVLLILFYALYKALAD